MVIRDLYAQVRALSEFYSERLLNQDSLSNAPGQSRSAIWSAAADVLESLPATRIGCSQASPYCVRRDAGLPSPLAHSLQAPISGGEDQRQEAREDREKELKGP